MRTSASCPSSISNSQRNFFSALKYIRVFIYNFPRSVRFPGYLHNQQSRYPAAATCRPKKENCIKLLTQTDGCHKYVLNLPNVFTPSTQSSEICLGRLLQRPKGEVYKILFYLMKMKCLRPVFAGKEAFSSSTNLYIAEMCTRQAFEVLE